MATVQQNQEDDSQNGGQQSNGGSSAPVPVAGATGGNSASASPSGTSEATSPGSNSTPAGTSGNTQNTSSGQFTNLKSYLNANSSYNGGAGLAGQVNSDLSNQASGINSNINNAGQQFNNQTVNSVQPVQQNYNNFESATGNGSDLSKVASYAQDAGNVANTQAVENAQYTGPNSLNDLSGQSNGQALQGSVNDYNSLVNNTNTQAGRTNLLSSLYGNQGYNQGQQTLDNVFLQGQNFAPAQAQGAQLNNTYNTTANNATAQGQQAHEQVAQYANNVQGQLNTDVGSVNNNIQGEYNTNMAGQAGQLAQQQAALNSGSIGSQLAQSLGLTNGENTYNTNLGNYVSANNNYSAQDAATGTDYGQISALNSLLGNNANSSSANTLAQYANAPANPQGILNYNQSGLATDLGAAGSDWKNQSQPLLSTIQNNPQAFGTGGQIAFDPTSVNTAPTGAGMLTNQAAFNNLNNMFNGTNGASSNGLTGQAALNQYVQTAQQNNFDPQYASALSNLIQSYNAYQPGKTINVGS